MKKNLFITIAGVSYGVMVSTSIFTCTLGQSIPAAVIIIVCATFLLLFGVENS